MPSSLRKLLGGSSSISWLQPLPTEPPADRRGLIVGACRGKRVIHLGFTDEHLTADKQRSGRWLHADLDEVASSLVGLDLDREGVERAQALGYEAYVVDAQSATAIRRLSLQPADVVVAGEIIEHLESPGHFLRAVKPLLADGGRLIVTTPNAYRTVGFLAPLLGEELIHPDHVGIHSIHTLRTLGRRAGYHVEQLGYYQNAAVISSGSAVGTVARVVRTLQAWLLRRRPHWSDGIYAIFTRRAR
ncbi:MAG TPA: methyltransferase domain-containing protein [Gaiellaceae bacterium]|jgi:SAM-dependent methyltransferase